MFKRFCARRLDAWCHTCDKLCHNQFPERVVLLRAFLFIYLRSYSTVCRMGLWIHPSNNSLSWGRRTNVRHHSITNSQHTEYAASQAARASQAQRSHQDTESSDDENTPPANMQLLLDRSGGKAMTLRVQLVEKDARILELETVMSELRLGSCKPTPSRELPDQFKRMGFTRGKRLMPATVKEMPAVIAALKLDVSRLQDQNFLLTSYNSTLLQENTNILLDNTSLNSLKRKADSTHTEELRGRNKRIKRMERERAVKKDTNAEVFEALKDSLDASAARIAELESQLSAHISSYNSTVRELRSTLRDKQSTLTATRNTSRKQNKSQLAQVRPSLHIKRHKTYLCPLSILAARPSSSEQRSTSAQ
ncbi:hypothetical protein B0H13DRAFT_2284886 [Mycena leptocephala]|nr:hypothetical protein B0H13DRAFT_2284886 [Mycena leptocephala]